MPQNIFFSKIKKIIIIIKPNTTPSELSWAKSQQNQS